MPDRPARDGQSPPPKATELTDLSHDDEHVRGGALAEPVRRQADPCIRPGEIVPCVRNR